VHNAGILPGHVDEPVGRSDAAPSPSSPLPVGILSGLIVAVGILVPLPVVNLLAFGVLASVLGSATMRNRNPPASRPRGWVGQKLVPATILMVLGAAVVVLCAYLAFGEFPAVQAVLAVLSLMLVVVWWRSRRAASTG
jgi:hypothetical protein